MSIFFFSPQIAMSSVFFNLRYRLRSDCISLQWAFKLVSAQIYPEFLDCRAGLSTSTLLSRHLLAHTFLTMTKPIVHQRLAYTRYLTSSKHDTEAQLTRVVLESYLLGILVSLVYVCKRQLITNSISLRTLSSTTTLGMRLYARRFNTPLIDTTKSTIFLQAP